MEAHSGAPAGLETVPRAVAAEPRGGSEQASAGPRPVRGRWWLAPGLFSALALIVVWQLAVSVGVLSTFDVSDPGSVAMAGYALVTSRVFLSALTFMLYTFAVGFGLALVVGVPTGILLGWYRTLGRLLFPYVNALNATPRIALFPLFLVWFGLGMRPQVVIVFLGGVIPIIVNTFAGVRSVDPAYLDVASCQGADTRQVFRTVVLPASVPFIMAGIRLASAYGLLGVVIAEMFLGSRGIGYLLSEYANSYQTADVIFLLILVAVAGLGLVYVFERVESRWDSWRVQR